MRYCAKNLDMQRCFDTMADPLRGLAAAFDKTYPI